MGWLDFIVGIAVGAAGCWLYYRYINQAQTLGKTLLTLAEGDVQKVKDFINKW